MLCRVNAMQGAERRQKCNENAAHSNVRYKHIKYSYCMQMSMIHTLENNGR